MHHVKFFGTVLLIAFVAIWLTNSVSVLGKATGQQ